MSLTWAGSSMRLEAGLIGGAHDRAALDAAAGHPHREAGRVMVAAAAAALADRRSAELASPDDQGILEQAGALEVGEQGRHGLVGHSAHLLVVGVDVVVGIPLNGDRAAA